MPIQASQLIATRTALLTDAERIDPALSEKQGHGGSRSPVCTAVKTGPQLSGHSVNESALGATMKSEPVILIHEDRLGHDVGVQLAVLSLARHSPTLNVYVSFPCAGKPFGDWLEKQPNAERIVMATPSGTGWNIKPSALLEMLGKFSNVVWLDSDILVTGNISSYFSELEAPTLLASEETFWGQQPGNRIRTSSWGLDYGRQIKTTINTGILRVTSNHSELLNAWQKMLTHPLYVKAQHLPWYKRPVHMVGDQDALTALLGASHFANIPIRLLRRGVDIAQCFGPSGFTPLERSRAWRKQSIRLIHAMGAKPWVRRRNSNSTFQRFSRIAEWRIAYENLSLDLSPYTIESKQYQDCDVDLAWAFPKFMLSRAMQRFWRSDPILSGLPLATIDHLARYSRKLLGIGRYQHRPEFFVTDTSIFL